MKLDIEREVASLEEMTTGAIRERYVDVFGEESRSRHKAYLIRKIAWRLQANAEGDLSERARLEIANGPTNWLLTLKSARHRHGR